MARAKPNLDWLPDARAALNVDPAFRKLGSADFKLGLVLGDDARLVTFEAFEIAAISAADRADMRDADIVLEMAPKDWNAYLRQRGRSRAGSLLSLDLSQHLVKARSPVKRLMFERYNRTVQALLDKGAALTATP
jgi:hypothetical protein